jgi:hypothetical protein
MIRKNLLEINPASAILAVALAAMAVSAQMVDLKGRVLEKAGNLPVPGAVIKVAGSTLSALTDTAGRFVLKGAVTALRGGGQAWVSAPFIRNGELNIESAEAGRTARVEIHGLGGERLAASVHALGAGWNRIRALPVPAGDFLGFIRVTVEGETWVMRTLQVSGLVQAGNRPAAEAGRLAKRAGGAVEVSMAKLTAKTVPYAQDVADLGDIVLEYPARKLDVDAPPIYGASVLFDGSKGRAAALAELNSKWQDWPRFTPSDIKFKLAKDPAFPADTGKVTLQSCCNTLWGYDDIQAKEVHGDAQLHVEWIGMGKYDETENPDLGPAAANQPGYINSGVYIQSRYEVQIESPGVSDAKHTMASLVDEFGASSLTPDRGNGKWQAYDITFRAARYNASGTRTEYARISVWWNGILVHDNRETRGLAAGLANHSGEELNATLYGLKLQSEGKDVRFRNIWVKPLVIPTAQTGFGY